ncbi:MAG: CPBP family glutamic-type intramembrane protease, partial [Planctomycetota bacterium]
MGEEPTIVVAAQGVLILASLAFVGRVAAKRWAGGRLLDYVPRRPVPWQSLGGTGLAVFLLVLTIGDYTAPRPPEDNAAAADAEMTDSRFIETVFGNAAAISVIGLATFLAIRNSSGATLADFGLDDLPTRWRADVRLGAAAALFLTGPVYLVHIAVATLVESPSQNPTLLIIAETSNPLVYAAAFFGAVLLAPVWEEFVFRGLLQGWLERVEDELLGWRTKEEPAIKVAATDADASKAPIDDSGDAAPEDEAPAAAAPEDEAPEDEDNNPYRPPMASPTTLRVTQPATQTPPPNLSVAGLPHGWAPVLVSALGFALVHLGAGPDPVPLLLFGVVIGFLYQRTHRLLACVACHLVFN